jgi:Ribosomal protein L1
MAKLTKRQQMIAEKVDQEKVYPFEEAVNLLAEVSKVKFTESFEVAVNLGVDPRKSDQVVRGATVMPNGTGKDVRVCVFAQVRTQTRQQLPERILWALKSLRKRSKADDWILTW